MRIAMPITSTAVLLIGVSSILAADVNLPFDSRTAEQKEESCWKIRYRKCDGIERSEDLVLVFPSNQFKRNRARHKTTDVLESVAKDDGGRSGESLRPARRHRIPPS